MFKKVIIMLLSLCLISYVCVLAENQTSVTNKTFPESVQDMPQEMRERPVGERGNIPQMRDRENRGTPPAIPNGEMPPERFTPPQSEEDFTPPNHNEITVNESIIPETDNKNTEENAQTSKDTFQFGGQMPGGMGGFPSNMQSFNGQTQEEHPKGFLGFARTYSTPITSVVLLGLAFIFVIFYRRKNY